MSDNNNVSSDSIGLSMPSTERQISERIARVLSPDDITDDELALFDKDEWDDDHLDRLINAVSVRDLPEIIRQRQAAGHQRPAGMLEWNDITVVNEQKQPLLSNVSGYLRAGELVGLIGAGDSGVTPLLNQLAGSETGRTTGHVVYDGHKVTPDCKEHKRHVGLVVKSDNIHIPTLTVFETLWFSARLRLPSSIPDRIVRYRVKLVAKILGIAGQLDTPVGDDVVRGISGGQKRRLGFGVEIVAGHSVLLADLPTNGLDTATAVSLIHTLSYACKGGISVLASLASPSDAMLNTLDRIIVLSKGYVVYNGPAKDAEECLAKSGFHRTETQSLPQFLEQLSDQPEMFYKGDLSSNASLPASSSQQSISRVDSLDTLTKAGKGRTISDPDACECTSVASGDLKETVVDKKQQQGKMSSWWYKRYASSPWIQLKTIMWRQAVVTYRDVGSWRDQWICAICLGFWLGSFFYNLKIDDNGIRDRMGLMLFVACYTGFNSLSIIPTLTSQRGVYYAQQHRGYHAGPFYHMAFLLSQLPLILIEAFLLLTPVWGLAGLSGYPIINYRYWFALLALVTHSWISRAWAMLLMGAAPDVVWAGTLLLTTTIINAQANGSTFTPEIGLSSAWMWANTISSFKYVILGIVTADVSHIHNACPLPLTADCSFEEGTDALHQLFGLSGSENMWYSWLCQLAFLGSFFIAGNLVYTYVDWSAEDSPAVPTISSEVKQHQADSQPEDEAAEAAAIDKTSQSTTLRFYDLCYTVKLPDGSDRVLLNDVYGDVEPGNLVALMGTTGAGKSTLLDVLAGKKTVGKITGTILINDMPVSKDAAYSRHIGYVEQMDSHNPLSTVRETVYFSGRLRLGKEVTRAQLNDKVDAVLATLRLTSQQDSIVGAPGMGGVSQETRKLLTIAVELISEPRILFLDEPTTGLDSTAAIGVMKAVKELSKDISVLCTIHQPPLDIVNMFDNLLVLRTGGTMVYNANLSHLAAYSKDLGWQEPADDENPADALLDRVSKADDGDDLASKFRESEIGKTACGRSRGSEGKDQVDIKVEQIPIDRQESVHTGSVDMSATASVYTQIYLLTSRQFQNYTRDRRGLGIRIGLSVFFGLIVGTMIFQLQFAVLDSQLRVSAMYLTLLFAMFLTTPFLLEPYMSRAMNFRETGSRMYSPYSVHVSRMLAHIPIVLVEMLILAVMVDYISNINTTETWFLGYYYLILVTVRMTALAFVYMLAATITSAGFSNTIAFTSFSMLFACGGFLQTYSQTGWWWRWMIDINFINWSTRFITPLAVQHQQYTCSSNPADLQLIPIPAGYDLCPIPADLPAGMKCSMQCGQDLLAYYSIDDSDKWIGISIAIVWSFFIFFFVVGGIATRYVQHIKR